MTATNESDATAHAMRFTRSRAVPRVVSLFAALGFAAASSTASAQLAGVTEIDAQPATTTTTTTPAATPARPHRTGKPPGRARTASLFAAPAAATSSTTTTTSATPLVIAQAGAPTSSPTAAPPPAVTNVSVIASTNAGPPGGSCVPDCRSGFVCREGECVSACNPMCGDGETCNAKRECVATTEATESRTYDKVRFGVGGHLGVGSSSDGEGTAYGGHIMLSVPLGGHLYTREDIMASYYRTSATDDQVVGAGVPAYGTTNVDQQYLLIALRATLGYQFGTYVNVRAGVLVGSHTLTVDHGYCGTGPQSQSFNSFAAGGTGALGFALKHVELAVIGDVYDADTQAVCGVLSGPYSATQPATLVPRRDVAAQFLAQATILF